MPKTINTVPPFTILPLPSFEVVNSNQFGLPGPISPGQPIMINWAVEGGPASSLKDWGNVVATISFEGNVLYQSAASPPSESTISSFGTGGTLTFYNAGEINVTITIPAAESFAGELYKVGTHTLTLSVVGDARPAVYVVTATADLIVAAEQLDPGAWAWTGPTNGDFFSPQPPWNTPYTVSAAFTNRSEWTAWTIQYILWETNDPDNLSPVARASGTFTVNSGGSVPVASSAITQNWSWLTCPFGTLTDDLAKSFSYTIASTARDNWGNSYTWPSPGPLVLFISVPTKKYNLAQGAAVAEILGLGSAGFTFGLGAAVGAAAAAALCAAANDPPTPDPDYMVAAEILMPPLPDIPDHGDMPETRACLELILKYTAIAGAVGRTQAKLLGAKESKDAAGIRVQVSSYKRLHELLMTTAAELPHAITLANAELNAKAGWSQEQMNATLYMWRIYGIPADVEKTWSDQGLSSGTIAALRTFVAANENALPPLSQCLAACADSIILDAKSQTNSMNELIGEPS
jgi:hypothetical protein